MRRIVLACVAVVAAATAASAQPTATPSNYVVGPGGSTTINIQGTAGQQFAVLGSATNSGFAYAGVTLAVGTDVQILGIGALDGAGQGSLVVTPPFPTRDRFYVQVATSGNGFASIAASGSITLVNSQEARIYLPIGGAVLAAGTLQSASPGVTVTRNGVGNYTVSHVGFFQLHTPIPLVTPTGNATITSIQFGGGSFTVQLSGDANFAFAVIPVRR